MLILMLVMYSSIGVCLYPSNAALLIEKGEEGWLRVVWFLVVSFVLNVRLYFYFEWNVTVDGGEGGDIKWWRLVIVRMFGLLRRWPYHRSNT